MKHLKNLVLFVLLASAQFAYSNEACDPCDPCYMGTECDLCNVDFCDMEFEVYVDALYWHGCSNDLFIGDTNTNVDPDYSWGWRIGASAYWNSWDIGIRYSSFSTKTDDQLVVVEDTFNYSYDLDYDVFDVELGRACCICEGILFRPFVGAKFARIEVEHENIFDIAVTNNQKLEGAGLYIGFDNRWQMCSFNMCDCSIPVALVSRLSTGVMDVDFKRSVDGSEIEFKDCQFVPVHELYTGLEFRMCGLCNADAFFQIGYETQYWGWRAVDESNDLAHLGVGGLVLRFGANF